MGKGEYCTEVLKDPGFPVLLDKQYLQMNTTTFAQVPWLSVAHQGVQKSFSHSLSSVFHLLLWRIGRCLLIFLCSDSPWKLLQCHLQWYLSYQFKKKRKSLTRSRKIGHKYESGVILNSKTPVQLPALNERVLWVFKTGIGSRFF